MPEHLSDYVLRNKNLWHKNIHKVLVILVRLRLVHGMRGRNGLGLGSPQCVDVNGACFPIHNLFTVAITMLHNTHRETIICAPVVAGESSFKEKVGHLLTCSTTGEQTLLFKI